MTAGIGRETRARGSLSTAWRSAVAFDRRAIEPFGAARAALGCVIALTIGLVVFGDPGAASATVGALLTGVPSVASVRRRPLGTMAATTFGLALSTFVGASTSSEAALHLVILVAWAFGAGLLVALGDIGAVVGTQATMAYVVFGRFPERPLGAAELAAYIVGGGVIQMLLVALSRWPVPLGAQRSAVAEAYGRLAELARGGPEHSTVAAGSALDAADEVLDAPALLRRDDGNDLRGLVDEGRRLRIELASLKALEVQARTRHGGAGSPDDAPLGPIADALSHIANVVAIRPIAAPRGSRGLAAQVVASPTTSGADAVDRAIAEHLAAIAGQIRAATALAERAVGGRRRGDAPKRRQLGDAVDRLRADLALLRANVSTASTAFRHAVRLAVVVLVAELLAAHTPLQRGYWVPLTAALILRPDFATTFSRGLARLVGTMVGVAVTGLIVAGGHLGGAPAVVIIGVLAFGGFALFRATYAGFTALLTGLVVLLINLGAPNAHSSFATVGDRLVDTVIGGALALVTYALWPSWSTEAARRSLVDTLEDERAYLGAVLEGLTTGTADEGELRTRARRLRLTRTNADATVARSPRDRRASATYGLWFARSLAEPEARRVNRQLASGLLAGLRRISLTTHVLRNEIEKGPVPELTALAAAFPAALRAIAAAIGGRPAPDPFPPLRALHDELAGALAGQEELELVVVELDEIVDALDTLGDLTRVRRPATD